MRKGIGQALVIIVTLCLYTGRTGISSKVEFANGPFESLKYANKSIATSATNATNNSISEVSDFINGNAVLGLPISYRLVRGQRYNRSETNDYACRNATTWEPLGNRPELPTSNPFDFNTFIKTSLNILIMGDSVAMQFGSWFQTAGGATNKTVLVSLYWRMNEVADGLVIAPVDGGGSIAYWRILAFWEKANARRGLPNRGPGWRESWVDRKSVV